MPPASGHRTDAQAAYDGPGLQCSVTFSRAFAFAAALGFASDVIGQSIQLGMPIACEPGRTCYIQNYVDADPSALSAGLQMRYPDV